MQRHPWLVGIVLAVFACGAAASEASGAVTIGETFAPTTVCPNPTTAFGSPSPPAPAVQFVAPSSGVITSWSFRAAATVPTTMRFKVGRLDGGGSFTVVGEGGFETPIANTLNTFPTRVGIQAGDVIGYHMANPNAACGRALAGYGLSSYSGDVPVGTAPPFGTNTGYELDLSATLESDADNDGFGDETQDGCPGNALRRDDCLAPETTITGKPKAKTKASKAKFEFSASEAGSTFRCSLDGSGFELCESPKAYRVKPGKHNFTVLAKDAADNAEEIPATARWTVKKKKRK